MTNTEIDIHVYRCIQNMYTHDKIGTKNQMI